jgi:hypothetical protein
MAKVRFWTVYPAIFMVLGYTTHADANFVIKLKNGNEYVTSHYWQEGRQLFFDAYGGVFGVEKSFIAKVERSSSARLTQTDNQPAAVNDASPRQKNESLENTSTSQTKVETQRVAGDPIVTEFDQLRDRSKRVDSLLTSEIRLLMKEITEFKNKLSKDSKLFIKYGREFNEAHDLADVVETVLTARTQ